MSYSNSMRVLRRPSALEVMDMKRRIYHKFGFTHESFLRMVIHDLLVGDQRQFDAKPVSAIQHFI